MVTCRRTGQELQLSLVRVSRVETRRAELELKISRRAC